MDKSTIIAKLREHESELKAAKGLKEPVAAKAAREAVLAF
jgi:hypothetical protein